MKNGFLERIVATKAERVAAQKRLLGLSALRAAAESNSLAHYDFAAAISRVDRTSIIAEFKRASPSKGDLHRDADAAEIAEKYQIGGAAAVSVVTEEDHFNGSLDDLRSIRNTIQLPILRKDFIIDEYQIYESATAGADAILLIAAILEKTRLAEFQCLARELGISSILEVHDREELEVALQCRPSIVGVNNRNLATFHTSLETSRNLIKHIPAGIGAISESGLSTREQITELQELGYSGFLIGETLMKSDDTIEVLKALCNDES